MRAAGKHDGSQFKLTQLSTFWPLGAIIAPERLSSRRGVRDTLERQKEETVAQMIVLYVVTTTLQNIW